MAKSCVFFRSVLKHQISLSYLLSLFIITILSSCGSSGNNNSPTDSAAAAESPAATSSAAAIPAIKKYGIKSGIVTFESKGMGITRKAVLYFDEYGSKEAEEKYDENNNIEESSLCDGKNRYIIKYKDKTAYSQGECYRGVAYKFDWEEAAKADPEYKAKKLANISVAGKDCESFSMESSGNTMTYAGWNNVCLLLDQTTQYGDITYRAVSIEENPAIPSGKLTVPEGFQVK